MKTEEEEQSDYDFGSRESSAQVTVKEFSFPLSPVSSSSTPSTPLTTWPYSTLLTPQSLVSPSQLVLGVKRSSSPASSSTTEPPAKKVKRKARTEEEKQASANERIMRNRRAAQESRDRKKRQLESLEEENRRLQQENATMKRRIEQLESQQSSPTLEPASDISPTYCDVIKEEVFSPESFESTFHPAAMESDQQCPSISLKTTPLSSTQTSTLSYPLYHLWTIICLQPLFSTLFSLTTRTFLMNERLARSPATFNSLNTGSLFTGAENGVCIDSRQWAGLVV